MVMAFIMPEQSALETSFAGQLYFWRYEAF
jgi:hypothetical protein